MSSGYHSEEPGIPSDRLRGTHPGVDIIGCYVWRHVLKSLLVITLIDQQWWLTLVCASSNWLSHRYDGIVVLQSGLPPICTFFFVGQYDCISYTQTSDNTHIWTIKATYFRLLDSTWYPPLTQTFRWAEISRLQQWRSPLLPLFLIILSFFRCDWEWWWGCNQPWTCSLDWLSTI